MKNKRNALEWIAIIIAVLCIIGAGVLTIAYGFTVGNAITFIVAFILISLGLWMRKMPKRVQKCLSVIIITGLIFFFSIAGVVIVHGTKDTATFDEDCVLVLGCGIRGESLLPTLEDRLNKCLEYLKKNPRVLVLVSGGQGPKEDITEAEAMMRYLVQQGIPRERILKEEESRNTIQNLSYSKSILDSLFVGSEYTIAVVTSDYHAYRVKQAASEIGLSVRTYNAGVKWYLRPSAYSREVLSLCKYWIAN